jgi:hypothetical protein
MGHSYKGASCPAGNVTLWAAPVMTSVTSGTLVITPHSGLPPNWRIDVSGDGGTTWGLDGVVAGTLLTLPGQVTGELYRCQGVASDGSPVTALSNAVVCA